MTVVIYARVSDPKQAEAELSIPAQLRLTERYAHEHGWSVVGSYQDVASGRFAKQRLGLHAAISHAKRDKSITGLVVHKIDRLARSQYDYQILKAKLKNYGVRIHSVVEQFEASPIGELVENIMASFAEFYSANLASEVKKGLDQRLLKGLWNGMPPLGYIRCEKRIIIDPARGTKVREAFELWVTGKYTTQAIAEMMYERGLVGANGKKIEARHWCRYLKNHFYYGSMHVAGGVYQGIHPPLVTKELFEKAQEVFRQKTGDGRRYRRHLMFLLAGKLRCPTCANNLIGERHVKPVSGKEYRYYRCHYSVCQFYRRADQLEKQVIAVLLATPPSKRSIRDLSRKIALAKQELEQRRQTHIRTLRDERKKLDDEVVRASTDLAHGELPITIFEEKQRNLISNIRATEWLLAKRHEDGQAQEDVTTLRLLKNWRNTLTGDQALAKRMLLDWFVERVEVRGEGVEVTLKEQTETVPSPTSLS